MPDPLYLGADLPLWALASVPTLSWAVVLGALAISSVTLFALGRLRRNQHAWSWQPPWPPPSPRRRMQPRVPGPDLDAFKMRQAA